MLKKFFPILGILFCQSLAAQQQNLYNPAIDVQHYTFQLEVSDRNDSLTGTALITVRFTEKLATVSLDLSNINDTGRGMLVTSVLEDGKKLAFTHKLDRLIIQLATAGEAGSLHRFAIHYKGIPADGLIIGRNQFGRRTFFSDNWPNRAHHWIPCKDHLSDKASVTFVITAPDHYKVVSNGVKTKEILLPEKKRRTHWTETVPLPVKVMAVGIADFAVEQAGEVNGVPIASWVFPENKQAGFYDYAQATEILPFFMEKLGAYPYHKLANVQSKTIFGGMENAGAIFYTETSITGKRQMEELLTHEIAHQWFGNHATETDWPHLWLSEGFATAMTHLYMEYRHGKDTLTSRLQKDRETVLAFTRIKKTPVVDSIGRTKPMTMLNAHSYQKGGWILLMLRNQLGDAIFWKIMRTYYQTYQNRNASTEDLQKVAETVSGKALGTFFRQWLYTAENPDLDISWNYVAESKEVRLVVTQKTATLFSMPLDIAVTDAAGKKGIQTITIGQKTTIVSISVNGKPVKVEADPDCRLLAQYQVKENQ
ncbi:MAG: M1 family metallopeptidase [Chitinophagaceae bacterium]|nr:M1 family metallopeptidase [Chitinophagaceae bacterium]MCA6452010.1 M1 family metallopeptidase [Chitinophagaceae bacterium]MCA6455361.1 M1 family metallopeptidase [Chitinophagaceae bacterium]MCA6459087.1 M1 family metallopeptidase [Chitinophagaceae bacterium]MCA6465617.1 M1 family metallopeptidase [Chitinophagaceae bacterium]